MIPTYQDTTFVSARSERSVFLGITSAIVSLAFSVAVLYFSILRETPMFWRNAGGYSVEFREFVLEGFYVCVVGSIIMLMFGVITLVNSHRSWGIWIFHVSMVLLSGLVLATSGVIVVSNNIANLWEGRPLHDHSHRQ
jgi:hypothetical protein